MKTEQKKWTQDGGWQILSDNHLKDVAQLVFMFGDTDMLKDPSHFQMVRDWYPQAHIVSGSTAGEIIGTEVLDGSMVVTAVRFDTTTIQVAKTKIDTMEDSLP